MFTVNDALIDARLEQASSDNLEEAEAAVQQLRDYLSNYDLTLAQRERITRELPPRDPPSAFRMIVM